MLTRRLRRRNERTPPSTELGSGECLAGDSFSVADLTAASLFFLLVIPPRGHCRKTRALAVTASSQG